MVTTTAETELDLYLRRRANPDQHSLTQAYTVLNDPERLARIREILAPNGFTISENFKIGYSDPEVQKKDYRIITQILHRIIYFDGNDDLYNRDVLPQLSESFWQTSLSDLINKQGKSLTQGTPVAEHIEHVPYNVNTTGCSYFERVILRVGAFFHDTAGKAQPTKKDGWHDHAFISAAYIHQFLQENRYAVFGSMIQKDRNILYRFQNEPTNPQKPEFLVYNSDRKINIDNLAGIIAI